MSWCIDGQVARNLETGATVPVRVAQLADGSRQVWVAGDIFVVPAESAGPRRAGKGAAAAGDGALKAAMPGTILSLKVAVGDEVAAGQPLVVMESMKMELTLEAPRAGKVSEIAVAAGQLVDLGATLLKVTEA